MPIYLNRDLSSHSPAAGEQRLRGNSVPDSTANCVHIGLINNAGDGALQSTERQFLTLLDAAAEGVAVHLSFFALPDVPRNDVGWRRIGTFYSSIEDLWNLRLDGLIVTGMEPRAATLEEEPYWASMTRVLEWAEQNTHSTIWSCLAAHAAVFHRDGIARRRLGAKRCGVFKCTQVSDHSLVAGIRSGFAMPHSRWNDLSEDELTACGYRILLRANGAGADTFVKQDKSLFVFFQGHPEYEARTLLHEYARDVRRYLGRECETYPEIPHGYLDRKAAEALKVFAKRAVRDRREELLADFPAASAERNLTASWRSAAVRMYGNWLAYLCAMRDQPRKKIQARSESTRPRELTISSHAAGAD
jgi:homoserine O-succinyltransferase/O-acetyltransferase